MPNPVHPPLDQIKVLSQSHAFDQTKVQRRSVIWCPLHKRMEVTDAHTGNFIGEACRCYITPSTMLPLEVAALAAMRAGIQMAATEWPLTPMEDYQLA